jgi:hypothetical protein
MVHLVYEFRRAVERALVDKYGGVPQEQRQHSFRSLGLGRRLGGGRGGRIVGRGREKAKALQKVKT